jgi:hypothetical protein
VRLDRSQALTSIGARQIKSSTLFGGAMRRQQTKPKDHRRVPIPDELRDAMREVHEIVEEAENDPDISIDYDDAIQVNGLCGGRCGTKKRPFEFTFYPPGGDKRARWYLTLHPLEIEDIADGVMTDIMMYCCTSPECQMKFREPDETCFFCDYVDNDASGSPAAK